MTDTSAWIVANTHPQKEQMAMENLSRQGFHAYCPRIRKRIRHARRVQEVLRPLFPGYVFIRLNPKLQQWRPVAFTFGVRQLVQFGDTPGTIPDTFISGLSASERDGAVSVPRAELNYRPGMKVRLREGPFEDLIATVIRASDRDRIVVMMDLLKRSVRVKVPIGEILPA